MKLNAALSALVLLVPFVLASPTTPVKRHYPVEKEAEKHEEKHLPARPDDFADSGVPTNGGGDRMHGGGGEEHGGDKYEFANLAADLSPDLIPDSGSPVDDLAVLKANLIPVPLARDGGRYDKMKHVVSLLADVGSAPGFGSGSRGANVLSGSRGGSNNVDNLASLSSDLGSFNPTGSRVDGGNTNGFTSNIDGISISTGDTNDEGDFSSISFTSSSDSSSSSASSSNFESSSSSNDDASASDSESVDLNISTLTNDDDGFSSSAMSMASDSSSSSLSSSSSASSESASSNESSDSSASSSLSYSEENISLGGLDTNGLDVISLNDGRSSNSGDILNIADTRTSDANVRLSDSTLASGVDTTHLSNVLDNTRLSENGNAESAYAQYDGFSSSSQSQSSSSTSSSSSSFESNEFSQFSSSNGNTLIESEVQFGSGSGSGSGRGIGLGQGGLNEGESQGGGRIGGDFARGGENQSSRAGSDFGGAGRNENDRGQRGGQEGENGRGGDYRGEEGRGATGGEGGGGDAGENRGGEDRGEGRSGGDRGGQNGGGEGRNGGEEEHKKGGEENKKGGENKGNGGGNQGGNGGQNSEGQSSDNNGGNGGQSGGQGGENGGQNGGGSGSGENSGQAGQGGEQNGGGQGGNGGQVGGSGSGSGQGGDQNSGDGGNGSQAGDQNGGQGGGSGSGSGQVGDQECQRRDDERDIKILNLALSLSHLTSSFYNTSLSHLSRDDFISQGYEGWMYDRYCEINDHQVQHVWFLESAIGAAGGQGVERCDEYKFFESEEKQKQVWEFVKLSEALETISTSALNGAVKEIASRDYASVIASMMGVEARHASWIDSAIKKKSPWNTAFETPISFDQTYTLLSRFAKSCPGSNDALLPPSLRPHSQLDLPEDVKAGHPLLLGDLSSLPQNIDNAEDNALFAAFLLGTGTFVQPVHRGEYDAAKNGISQSASESSQGGDDDDDKKFWVNVPKELEGQGAVYIIIVQQRLSDAARGLRVEDGNTVAGPGLLVFPSKSGKSEGGDDWEEGYNALSCN